MKLEETINSAIGYINKMTDFKPEIGLILGSGLGDYADRVTNPIIIKYSEIPGMPVSTVEGHTGQFILGTHLGRKVIMMQGRFHYYEGYSQDILTIPVRIMRKLGVLKVIITNAAGGVNLDFNEGTLMVIRDHINYSGSNPLIGQNLSEYGPRFPDISDIYTKKCREKLIKLAKENDIALSEGVYMMFSGPCYETPAEVKMARILGADAVGMSTVPEGIVARHSGMEVIGVSCITNMAAGIIDAPLNHQEVVITANRVKSEFIKVIDIILKEVF